MRYTLIKDLVPMFEAKLLKLSKKFDKYGHCDYIKFTPYICENKLSVRYGYELVDIEVNAQYKINNYVFIATLDWIPELEENLIKKVSNDVFVPEKYKTSRNCDHCKANRHRKSTILLKNTETEEYVQVGKGCLKDYLGVDLNRYASYLSFFDDLNEYIIECERDNTARCKAHYSVREILKQTLQETHLNGYISKAQSIENNCDSTAYKICSMMFKVKDYTTGKLLYPKHEKFADDIEEQIDDVLKFYSEYSNSEKNDYVGNIKTILKLDWVEANNISLIASAIGTKIRIENEAKSKSDKIPSSYIGNVGEKIVIKGKPICIYSTESNYGQYHIYKINFDNNEIIWKTTKYLDTDKEYLFKGTIKSHEEFRGIKQTEITRAKAEVL